MKVKFDRQTKKWFEKRTFLQETTVCKCEKCGLYYKPSLGHKCKDKLKEEKQNEIKEIEA